MATMNGSEGTVTFNSISVDITDWNLTIETDVLNTTDSSDAATGWESNIASGFERFSGDFSGFLDDATSLPARGTSASLVLVAATGATTNKEFTGNAIITSVSPAVTVHGGDAVKFTANFTGTGALTETQLT